MFVYVLLGGLYCGRNWWIILGKIKQQIPFAWHTWCIWHHILTILASRCQRILSKTSCCFEAPICKCPHAFPKEENVVPILVLEIISSLTLDLQQRIFKIPMKNQTLNAMKISLDFNHSYDILGARMLWKPKESRILKNFIEF